MSTANGQRPRLLCNFGIPDGRINSANFLNQWATNGGNRRIWVAVRYVF